MGTAPARSVTWPGLGPALAVSRLSRAPRRSHGATALQAPCGVRETRVANADRRRRSVRATGARRLETAGTCACAPGSTARETAAPGYGHSTGQVRDLAWTRPCAGGFPSGACAAPLPRGDGAAGALRSRETRSSCERSQTRSAQRTRRHQRAGVGPHERGKSACGHASGRKRGARSERDGISEWGWGPTRE